MKDRLVEDIVQAMEGRVNEEQLHDLKLILYLKMQDYEIEPLKTEVQIRDNSYEEHLKMFLVRKKFEGKSDRTVMQYKLHLYKLLDTLGKPLHKITSGDLFVYLAKYQKERNISNISLDNMRRVFSSFFTWLCRKKYIAENPTYGLDRIKHEKILKKPFSNEEREILKCECKTKRDMALLEFLYSTGVRVGELVRLNREDINFSDMDVIVFGKGAKEREVYLSESCCFYLKKYLATRKDTNPALFASCKAPYERLTIAGIENILRSLGKNAGVNKVHPHRYRRTMATNAIDRGMPVEQVSKLLGHEKIETTMIYCNVKQENIRYSHSKYLSA